MAPHAPHAPSHQQSQEQPSLGLITLARGKQLEIDLEIKKPHFLIRACRTDSMDEARSFVADIYSTYPDACHRCSTLTLIDPSDRHALAAIAPPTERSNDDDKSPGMAGQPMFDILRGTGLANTTAVVTRYFDGTLLGTDGLACAYSEAIAQTLQAAARVTLTRPHLWDLWVLVAQTGRTETELRSRNLAAASGSIAEGKTAVSAPAIHVEETIWGSTHVIPVLATSYADPDLLHAPLATLTRGEGVTEPTGSRLVEVPVPPAWSPGPSSPAPSDTLARHPRTRIMFVTTMRVDIGRMWQSPSETGQGSTSSRDTMPRMSSSRSGRRSQSS